MPRLNSAQAVSVSWPMSTFGRIRLAFANIEDVNFAASAQLSHKLLMLGPHIFRATLNVMTDAVQTDFTSLGAVARATWPDGTAGSGLRCAAAWAISFAADSVRHCASLLRKYPRRPARFYVPLIVSCPSAVARGLGGDYFPVSRFSHQVADCVHL
jgi:hypothetical protein